MTVPFGVISVFAGLTIWACLAVHAVLRRKYMPVLLFGIFLMLYLNAGYVIYGPAASIANFVGIYDVLINLGLSDPASAAAVSTCPNNSCSAWGETFTNHPAWGVAFYNRFANGPEIRSALLLGHVVCNTIVFVLMHVQVFFPGGQARNHALIGRVCFGILTVGVGCSVVLAAQHGSVSEYGGALSTWGFVSMSMFVYTTAVLGVFAIRRQDTTQHRIWMWRFVGSMWGGVLAVSCLAVRNRPALSRHRSPCNPNLYLGISACRHPDRRNSPKTRRRKQRNPANRRWIRLPYAPVSLLARRNNRSMSSTAPVPQLCLVQTFTKLRANTVSEGRFCITDNCVTTRYNWTKSTTQINVSR